MRVEKPKTVQYGYRRFFHARFASAGLRVPSRHPGFLRVLPAGTRPSLFGGD